MKTKNGRVALQKFDDELFWADFARETA